MDIGNLINQNEKSIQALGIGGIIFLVVIFLILIFSMVAAFKPVCQQVSEKFGTEGDTFSWLPTYCNSSKTNTKYDCYNLDLRGGDCGSLSTKKYINTTYCYNVNKVPSNTNSTTNFNYNEEIDNEEIDNQEFQIKKYNNNTNGGGGGMSGMGSMGGMGGMGGMGSMGASWLANGDQETSNTITCPPGKKLSCVDQTVENFGDPCAGLTIGRGLTQCQNNNKDYYYGKRTD